MDAVTTNDVAADQTFNRDRLLELVDGLERDIALVEEAMDALESENDDSVDAVLAVFGAPRSE